MAINIILGIFLIICLNEIIKIKKDKKVNSPLTKIIPEEIFSKFYLITLIVICIVILIVFIINLLKYFNL